MSNRASLGHVFDQLQQNDFIEPSTNEVESQPDQQENPWFIEGLAGCGGWIAAIFLLASIILCVGVVLADAGDATLGMILMVAGAIFLGGTTLYTNTAKSAGTFLSQLLLTLHIAGHFALIGGVNLFFALWETDTGLLVNMIFVIIVQILFILLYANAIYRFLAMLAIAGALGGIFLIYEIALIITVSIGILLALAIVIWLDMLPVQWHIKYMDLLKAVGYGATIGALGLLIYEVSNRFWVDDVQSSIQITGVLVVVMLLWVEVYLLREYDLAITSSFSIGVLGFSLILGLIVLGTPGILAGLVVILLAFRRRNLILQGIGYAYLAGFVIYYYYWLDVTLLTKSIILIVTGLLLLAGRFGLNRLVLIPDEEKGTIA